MDLHNKLYLFDKAVITAAVDNITFTNKSVFYTYALPQHHTTVVIYLCDPYCSTEPIYCLSQFALLKEALENLGYTSILISIGEEDSIFFTDYELHVPIKAKVMP